MPSDAVRNFLNREQIHDQHITCALSGGADSVCLLSCLKEWRNLYALELSAIHIQHNLRGEESLRDEAFCRQLCEMLDIPLLVIPVDVQAYRHTHGGSVETAARECRYQAFEKHASGWIATAHTASDHLETILFRVARGTGLKGLCGIPSRRDQYIRPLLTVNRHQIENYLLDHHLGYITDSSNLQDDYTRNFIRHQVIPPLEQVHSHPEYAAVRMSEILIQEENFLDQSARNAFDACLQDDGSLKDLQNLHPAIQRRCIAILLERHHLKADYHQITSVQKLLPDGGSAELLRNRLSAHVSRHILYLENHLPDLSESPLRIGRNQIFPDFTLTAELIPKSSPDFEKIHKLSANSVLDYDILKTSVMLHGRKPGLRFRPVGRMHHIQIKKWIQTQPLPIRNVLHYLSDENGLLWVQNLGVSERAAVTDKTRTMLVLHIRKTDT